MGLYDKPLTKEEKERRRRQELWERLKRIPGEKPGEKPIPIPNRKKVTLNKAKGKRSKIDLNKFIEGR